MGLSDTEHTVLRETPRPRRLGKTTYRKFHIDEHHRANQIAETEVDEEMKNSTKLLSKMLKLLLCPLKHKIQLNTI